MPRERVTLLWFAGLVVRYPLSIANSKIWLRELCTRRPVALWGIQMGRRMSSTSSLVTSERLLASMGLQYSFELFHARLVFFANRSDFRIAPAVLLALKRSNASPRDGTGGLGGGGVRMSSPSAVRRALSKALSRAIFRVMTGWEPSPVLRLLPAIVKLCLQIKRSPPPALSLTTRVSPWLPWPSPYLPGSLMDRMKASVSRGGRLLATGAYFCDHFCAHFVKKASQERMCVIWSLYWAGGRVVSTKRAFVSPKS